MFSKLTSDVQFEVARLLRIGDLAVNRVEGLGFRPAAKHLHGQVSAEMMMAVKIRGDGFQLGTEAHAGRAGPASRKPAAIKMEPRDSPQLDVKAVEQTEAARGGGFQPRRGSSRGTVLSGQFSARLPSG